MGWGVGCVGLLVIGHRQGCHRKKTPIVGKKREEDLMKRDDEVSEISFWVVHIIWGRNKRLAAAYQAL